MNIYEEAANWLICNSKEPIKQVTRTGTVYGYKYSYTNSQIKGYDKIKESKERGLTIDFECSSLSRFEVVAKNQKYLINNGILSSENINFHVK